MSFTLPKLPHDPTAFAPTISHETFEYHYGKHHKAYVETLNKLLSTSPLLGGSLEDIVRKSEGKLFNNAAQAWNHTFYWHCFTPQEGERHRSLSLEKAVDGAFGSKEKFLEAFQENAVDNFGSGWTWLVRDSAGRVQIVNTKNADTPLTKGQFPLLVIDVWEHAYYIDHRNARNAYVKGFNKLLNWKFASERFDDAEVFDCTKLMRE